jgi:MHS family proline/betaine transporter-like MFS transporter
MTPRGVERVSQPAAGDFRRRALLAGCVGNLVEWYDFALYGAFATVIATTFLPATDPVGGLVATFGIFGVAFLARPAGALIFAHFGDRLGRRRSLAVGILLMAIVTAGIGLLPGHAAIGWLAPVLLGLLRAAQGIAVGGEFGGSATLVVEYAPGDRRGLYGGWQWATVGLGLAAGIGASAVVSALLPATALREWGWRVPFLLALPLGLVGLYVRTQIEETPAFRTVQRAGLVARLPLVDALRTARRQIVIGFGLVAAVSVTFNVFYVFLPSSLAARGQTPLSEALGAAVIGLLIGAVAAPVFGRWSDRIGRRPLLISGVTVLLLAIVPATSLILRGGIVSMLLGYGLIGIPLGALALSAFLAESFPSQVRYSGLSLTYGIASALFGGTAPLVAAVLARGGDARAPMWYAAGVTAVAAVCALGAPETMHRSLDTEASPPAGAAS